MLDTKVALTELASPDWKEERMQGRQSPSTHGNVFPIHLHSGVSIDMGVTHPIGGVYIDRGITHPIGGVDAGKQRIAGIEVLTQNSGKVASRAQLVQGERTVGADVVQQHAFQPRARRRQLVQPVICAIFQSPVT